MRYQGADFLKGASNDWKSRLSRNLLESSQQAHSQLIQQVQSICQDYEMRCQNVEAPLRSVRAKLDEANIQYEATKIKCDELLQKVTTDSDVIANLKSEINQFRSETDSSRIGIDSKCLPRCVTDGQRESALNPTERQRL